MSTKFISIFFLLFSGSTFVQMHEFHLSKCTIDYKEDQKAIQISMHIFIDDLEQALEAQGVDSLYIGSEKEAETTDKYIANYLEQRLEININDSDKFEQNFIGKETSDDLTAVWCYVEITGVKKLRSIHVKNQILQEIFDDQKNITKIIGPGAQSTYFMSQLGNNEKKVVYK